MEIHYEVKNKKLKKMLEKKAEEYQISLDQLILNYINRGLVGDSLDEDDYIKWHSEEFIKEVNEALDVD